MIRFYTGLLHRLFYDEKLKEKGYEKYLDRTFHKKRYICHPGLI